jgi:hypothetical protein
MTVIDRKRTVNTAQVISDFGKLYNPTNQYAPAREIGTNPMSHGKAKDEFWDFDEKTQHVRVFDNGSGIPSRDSLVVEVGVPRVIDPNAFDFQDKGIQALQQMTDTVVYITRNAKNDIFKQVVNFPDTVKQYDEADFFAVFEKNNPNLPKTFTLVQWSNTKREWTYDCLKTYLRRTFEHAIRLGRITLHLSHGDGKYETLQAWEEPHIKKKKIERKIKNTEITGFVYKLDKNPFTHLNKGHWWLSTKGILPSTLTAQYICDRDDILVSVNCDGLRDALLNDLGKERYDEGDKIYCAVIKCISDFIRENFPKPKDVLDKKANRFIAELNKAFASIWSGTEKPERDKKFKCAKCGKEISHYPCVFCQYDPEVIHHYKWQCNDCFERNCPDSFKNKDLTDNQKEEMKNLEYLWTWLSTTRTEINCPKCGSSNIVLIKQTKTHGIPKIVLDKKPDAINVRLGEGEDVSLEIVIGTEHNLWKEMINRPIGFMYATYIGHILQAMRVCKEWKHFVTPQGQGELDIMRDTWNETAEKEAKLLLKLMTKRNMETNIDSDQIFDI